jgi:nicotinic acid phosphoribosyltransferase
LKALRNSVKQSVQTKDEQFIVECLDYDTWTIDTEDDAFDTESGTYINTKYVRMDSIGDWFNSSEILKIALNKSEQTIVLFN